MTEINSEYIQELYRGERITPEMIGVIKETMLKYGDNHWWESSDPVTVATCQAFENRLIAVDRKAYHTGLEILLGRPVIDAEFLFNIEELRKEVRIGIERYKKGIKVSDEYKETATRRAIELVEKICSEAKIHLIGLNLNDSSEEDENGIDRSGEDGWLT